MQKIMTPRIFRVLTNNTQIISDHGEGLEGLERDKWSQKCQDYTPSSPTTRNKITYECLVIGLQMFFPFFFFFFACSARENEDDLNMEKIVYDQGGVAK
jgi:hypothetical protein